MIKVEDFIDPNEYEFKNVYICFAKPNIEVDDYMSYMVQARNKVFYNLYFRHGILIGDLSVTDKKNELILPVYYPKGTVFNAGMRLRGLSAYLLKYHKEIFEPLRVGKRLFWYTYEI